VHDVALRHQRHRVADQPVDSRRAVQFHALGTLKEHKVPQRRLTERHQR